MFQRNILRMTSSAAALFALLIAATPSSAKAGGIGDYFADRFHDVLDVVRLRAGIPDEGEGYGVKARVTSAAQLGYVNFDGSYAGINRRGIGVSREDREEGGISFLYFSEHAMQTRAGNTFLYGNTDWAKVRDRRLERNKPYWDDGQGDPLGIGAEVATPILALDLGVYPIEIADFALGIFTIDMMEDDRITQDRRPYREMLPTQPPVPNLTIAAQKKTDELLARRANIEGYQPVPQEEEARPLSIDQNTKQLLLDEVPLSQNPEPGIEIEAEKPTNQEALDSVLDASTPVQIENTEAQPISDTVLKPAVVEVEK